MLCSFCENEAGDAERWKGHLARCPCHPAVQQWTKAQEFLDLPNEPVDPNVAPGSLANDLEKSFWDHFQYLAILKNGFVFYYEEATPRGEWVHFQGVVWVRPDLKAAESRAYGVFIDSQARNFLERGIDVLRSEIAACADAPMGS